MILQILIFLIPVNIYILGNGIGMGLQWALFRYQQTYLGTSLIPLNREVTYLLTGIISGRSGISILLWVAGAILLVIALLLTIKAALDKNEKYGMHSAVCTILGGLVLAGSLVLQYGITLNGPAGFAMPIGIPLIVIIGVYLYWQQSRPCEPEDETPGAGENECEDRVEDNNS